MNLPHIAQRLFNTPLALHPGKAEVIVSALGERFGIDEGTLLVREYEEFSRPGKESGYEVVQGIAIIPVQGTLVNKLGRLRPYSGMTGYDGIRVNFCSALADPEVQSICLDIDSPGGEVAGCFDLVDLIFNARGAKPVHAILSETAYSAAYAIASAADRVTVPRTGGVGSIGVIYVHCDISQQVKNAGVKPTIITCGAKKFEANPLMPLSEEAQKTLQEDVNVVGTLFIDTVARNRGIDADLVRGMEGAAFRAERGMTLGLADAISPPDAAFLKLLNKQEK